MKFVTFTSAENTTAAPGLLVDGDSVIDLSAHGYASLLALIEDGPKGIDRAQAALLTGARLPLTAVTLHAPIPRPPRIFGIGLNYHSHAAESKMTVQKVPTVFMKLSSSVVGTNVPVVLPKITAQPDYEAELGVVIGKSGYQISEEEAMEYVFGYTIVNDISARDIQLATSQWTLGKSFPGFTPIGPAIVSADEVADPHNLGVRLAIDGETLQDANTSDLIFKIPALIAYLSSTTPLEAGDIMSTGTPQGVGLGRTPQRWLKPGEEMVITIDGLGELRNRTVAE